MAAGNGSSRSLVEAFNIGALESLPTGTGARTWHIDLWVWLRIARVASPFEGEATAAHWFTTLPDCWSGPRNRTATTAGNAGSGASGTRCCHGLPDKKCAPLSWQVMDETARRRVVPDRRLREPYGKEERAVQENTSCTAHATGQYLATEMVVLGHRSAARSTADSSAGVADPVKISYDELTWTYATG